ncbi:Kinesin light chain [Fusarium oxysporum f. sp. conglutinans]|nr:Kinesin light chain [Fusarium oxysporum f. sp. conglutinans]
MAEAVGLTASVVAIIDLSAKVATLCFQYSTAVGNARADIAHLQSRLNDLDTCLRGVHRVLYGPNNQALTISRELTDSLDGCKSELVQMQNRLDPGKARKTMRRLGLRALKWPFDSKEVSGIVANLEHYKQNIMLSLQIDQTTILLDIQQKFDGVSLQSCRDRPIARIPCFNVPFDRDPDFVDRPDITTWLQSQYTGSASRIALVGMGGFGKSQAAIQFAHHIHGESPQTSVYWVHASSKPRFEEAYRAIAERLQLPRRNDPDIDVLRLVRDWLQTEEAGSWLMILDNADDVNLFYPIHNSGDKAVTGFANENTIARTDQQPLAAYLPKRRNGTILITSRSMDAAERLTGSHKAIYSVPTMDDAQGLQLFQNKLDGDFDRDAATDVLRALDCIPLAITQAAAYINRRAPRVSVKTYLDTFQESDKKKGNLLNRDAGDLRRDETVSNSVVVTWQVTFEQIHRERPSAAKLLSFMSFFNPQGIPEFMLHDYVTDLTDHANSDTVSADFEDDLDILRGYSLVSVTATGDTYEMHALVQFCTRVWISTTGNEGRWRQLFLHSMSTLFPDGTFETWPTCQVLLPHIEPTFREEPPAEGLLDWAHLLTNCAEYMSTSGKYRIAESLSKKAVKTRTKMLGEEHSDTLTSMANLAWTYWHQGRYKEAEELLIGVIRMRKRMLGEEHPDTLTSIANLASVYWHQGRWKEAEELLIGVVASRKRILGEEHPDTLITIANLVSIYSNQGRYKEAEELLMRVVAISKRVLGEEHPDTLTTMAKLALLCSNQGRWKEAEELLVGVVKTSKRALGEEHPNTLMTMANLAWTYQNQGRWKEAQDLEVGVLEKRKRTLGEEHPHTLSSMSNLALIYWRQGLWKEAEELELI